MINHMKWALVVAAGIVAGSLSWAVAASAPDSYVKIEANSLLRTPQNAWARAILFSDTLESLPGKRARRLDRKTYLPMRLKAAGTVWVLEDMAPKFASLKEGVTYSFAGTVDQISRRYYVIVDSCYTVQTTTDMTEHWIDMLHPEQNVLAQAGALSEPAMQSLLLSAQNSLIKLAAESNVTVAQLIESQGDGGQRIAEHIVADALRGELRAQGKTADELMIGAVLALLQKQAVLDESARIAQEAAAVEPVAEARVEPVPVADGAPEIPESTDLPTTDVAAIQEESPVQLVEELAEVPAEILPEAVEPETVVDLAQADEPLPIETDSEGDIPDVPPTEEAEQIASLPIEEIPVPEVDVIPSQADEPALVEVEVAAELDVPDALTPELAVTEFQSGEMILPESDMEVDTPILEAELEPEIPAEPMLESLLPEGEGDMAQEEPLAGPPTSLLVVPMTDAQPDMIPLVSTLPTKAEIAQVQQDEKARLKEEKRLADIEAKRQAAEEKKAARLARIEAKRQAAADKKAAYLEKIEAKRLAAEEKKAAAAELAQQQAIEQEAKAEADRLIAEQDKAAAEARKAELARQKAEALQAREEEAAQKAAEWKAKQDAARAEAEAKKALAEQQRALAQQEKEALEAVRQAEIMAQQEEKARQLREETEQRVLEFEARKAAAEAALAEAEAQRQADLQRIQQEAEAKVAAASAEERARLAEKEAQQAEALRIAQDVTEHQRNAAEETAVRIAEEQATRQAAEERIAQMQREIEQMQVEARQTKSGSSATIQPGRDKEPAAAPLSAKEQRRLATQARQEQQQANKTKKPVAAEAAPVDPADLPEWMQPVVF